MVLKLDSAGVYQWHTFYGSASGDVGNSVAVTGDAVYVAGTSQATWDGDGPTGPKHAHSGGIDIMVLKLTGDGAYQWHTFYGSANDDEGTGIAVTEDRVYITGYSNATWDGEGPTGPIHGYTGSYDISILKLDSAGTYQWHTFYGSANSEWGRQSIAVTGDGVFVAGNSGTTWNGDGNIAPLHGYSGTANYDIAVLKLSDTNTVTYDGNGNTGGTVPVDASSPYLQGATVTVLGNTGTLVKTGYTFAGWNTAANGSGTSYTAGSHLCHGSEQRHPVRPVDAQHLHRDLQRQRQHRRGSVPMDGSSLPYHGRR